MGAKPTVKTNYLLTQIFYYEKFKFNHQNRIYHNCINSGNLQYFNCWLSTFLIFNTFLIMKNLFLLLVLFFAISVTAQTEEPAYKIVGNEIVSTKTARPASSGIKTNLTHTIKGIKYPVYQSLKGSYYILRTSKKTGKEYKQYLKV